ncbi:AAA family ATPase [Sphaerothrix gracilis]|uniref:AAA family ATPase n=1 Tax=Sphaerothrix gracilis TaxID=3151835 RepID=UPI0031FDEA0C
MTWKYKYFQGNCHSAQPSGMKQPPEAPPWRRFLPREEFLTQQQAQKQADEQEQTKDEIYWTKLQNLADEDTRAIQRGKSFRISTGKEGMAVIDAVNAAIHLRRPLLVTGAPGSGKTSLAYAIAYELQLGPVLTWPITARSNLVDAEYRYDAIARLQDAQLDKTRNLIDLAVLLGVDVSRLQEAQLDKTRQGAATPEEGDLGDYIQLGPVGTAFLPSLRPRVLLIDEIDKSDLNLPNDLLNLFEEGEFEIPELVRRKRRGQDTDDPNATVTVRTADKEMEAPVTNGRVKCCEFPIVIMTSNGERDFPPAFYRRCLRVQMPSPDEDSLKPIVQSHFEESDRWDEVESLIRKFVSKDKGKTSDRATDQLLNAVYLMGRHPDSLSADEKTRLRELLFQSLGGTDA